MNVRFKWLRLARHWHARLGVLAAVFFLILVITGVALNHTETLQLDQRRVQAAWLLDWYGLQAHTPQQGFVFSDGYFAWQAGTWVLDGRVLGRDLPAPVGAVQADGIRYLADAHGLSLYQRDGQRVDRLDATTLPATPIQALGLGGTAVIIRTPRGDFASSDGGLEWTAWQGGKVQWSRPAPLPVGQRAQVRQLLAPSLPLEQVLLDLHSGRLFGRFGPYLMDLAALVLLGLSLSGAWIYWQSIRRP